MRKINVYLQPENEMKEGNEIVPFCFYLMSADQHIEIIERFVNKVLQEQPEYFVVFVKIKPTNNIKVFIDGDNGITIEKCVQFNRKIYKLIEEEGLYPDGNFSLEVSSPGVDEPLKNHRQYQKNKGRFVEIIFLDDTKNDGRLIEVADADIILELKAGKGKKETVQQLVIPFNNIKSTTVQIKF